MKTDHGQSLEDFVADTLIQIVAGIEKAQVATKSSRGVIVPHGGGISGIANMGTTYGGDTVDIVQFDVAVVSTDSKETKGGVGVFVAPIALGSQGKSEGKNQAISRIQFRIPISLPRGDQKEK